MKVFCYLTFLMLSTGCVAHKIPGTDIEDTRETRSILQVMEQYRTALEQRDSEGILSLLAADYKDTGGTPTPEDDDDYQRLQKELPARLARLSDVRLELSVKKIEFLPQEKAARVIYNYSSSFRMPGLSSRAHTETEVNDMYLRNIDGHWKIVSGT